MFTGCSEKQTEKKLLSIDELFTLTKHNIDTSESFSFSLKHKDGYTSLPGGFDISKAQGDIQKPSKLRIDAEIISNNFLIKLSYLSMGKNYWITNPINFEWVETSQEDNPFKNINPVNILSDIFSEIENPAIISSQNYDYEISADINSENLKSLVGDIIVTNKNVRLSLNINQDGIVDSIKIYGIVQPNDSIDTQREIKFERWNENLKWETP